MLSTKDKCRLHLSWEENSSANTHDEHSADQELQHSLIPAPVSKWHSLTTARARGEECSPELTACHAKLVASRAIALEELAHL